MVTIKVDAWEKTAICDAVWAAGCSSVLFVCANQAVQNWRLAENLTQQGMSTKHHKQNKMNEFALG